MSKQLEKWPLPAQIHTDEYKCVLLRIPDKAEYIEAFYDSYDMLCRWLSWEKRGDTSARDAGMLFRKYQPLWLDCEIADAIDKDTGNMAIELTVNTTCNCNSNCGSDAPPFPPPQQVTPDGTPVETICVPTDPNNPSGDYEAISPDEETLTPPPGWLDWQAFIDEKCRASNYMVDALIGVVSAIDEAENRASLVMQIVQTVLQFVPVPVGKTSSWNKVLKWVDQLFNFIDDVEGVWDWAQEIIGVVEQKRNEVVCIIYTTPDIVTAAAAVAGATIDELTAVLVSNGITGVTQAAVLAFWDTLVKDIVPRAYDYEWVLSIPDGYQAPYNCSSCGGGTLGGDWVLLPMAYDGSYEFNSSGGPTNINLTDLGAYLRMSATADTPGDRVVVSPRLTCPDAVGLYPRGIHVDFQNLVNNQSFEVNELSGVDGSQLNDQNAAKSSPAWGVRTGEAQFELDTGIELNMPGVAVTGLFGGSYQATGVEKFYMGMGMESQISGTFSQDVKVFLICRTGP